MKQADALEDEMFDSHVFVETFVSSSMHELSKSVPIVSLLHVVRDEDQHCKKSVGQSIIARGIPHVASLVGTALT